MGSGVRIRAQDQQAQARQTYGLGTVKFYGAVQQGWLPNVGSLMPNASSGWPMAFASHVHPWERVRAFFL